MMLALLTFMVCVAYLPGIPSAASAPRMWVIAMGAATLLMGVRRIRATPGHWLGVALIGYCAATTYWGFSTYDEVGAIAQLLFLAGVFCLGAEAKTLRPCYIALALGVSVSSVFAIAQTVGLEPIVTLPNAGAPGLFLNRDSQAELAAVSVIGLSGMITPLLAGPLIVLMLVTSRGAFLGLAAGFASWLYFQGYVRPRHLITMALAAALLVGLDSYFVPWRINSLDGRFEMWNWAAANMTWFGWGWGDFGTVFSAFDYAHNEFIQAAFELGVGSLLLWAVFAYALGGPLAIERSILIAILVEGVVGFPLHTPTTAFMAALVAGRLCGARYRVRLLEREIGAADGAGFCASEGWGASADCVRYAGAGGMDVPIQQGQPPGRRSLPHDAHSHHE